MSPAQRKDPRIGIDDFEEMLLMRPENEKWELINGQLIKSMVGARWEHHRIVSNLDRDISDHLDKSGRPCRVFRETFFLKEANADLSALPDIMVHFGKLEPGQTSVDDPLILLEVVSKSSEGRDRFSKRLAYQRLPSLQQYVLVERDEPIIDIYRRTDAGWVGDPPLLGLDGTLELPAIDMKLPVAEIYRSVIDPEA